MHSMLSFDWLSKCERNKHTPSETLRESLDGCRFMVCSPRVPLCRGVVIAPAKVLGSSEKPLKKPSPGEGRRNNAKSHRTCAIYTINSRSLDGRVIMSLSPLAPKLIQLHYLGNNIKKRREKDFRSFNRSAKQKRDQSADQISSIMSEM